MIANESKLLNIFKEMRYFLMFYLNLGSMVCLALVLSFLPIGHRFSKMLAYKVQKNMPCNL